MSVTKTWEQGEIIAVWQEWQQGCHNYGKLGATAVLYVHHLNCPSMGNLPHP
jgi:hypothetical protein